MMVIIRSIIKVISNSIVPSASTLFLCLASRIGVMPADLVRGIDPVEAARFGPILVSS
jgi:hypothetical protein